MIETQMTEEARQALKEMISRGEVAFEFGGTNPVTQERTRFVGVKAKRKMFSKRGWKGRISYGDGTNQTFTVNGTNDQVEEHIWKVLKTIDADFLQMQRREAMGL